MRIGIDARLWNQTGVGRYVQELVTNLGKIDKENQYLIFARKNEINYQSLTANCQLRTINIRWHSLKEQIFLPFLLWREHLDLVHFPYFSVPVFYPGQFVVTIHDLILDHFDTGRASTLPWLVHKLKRCGYKLVLRLALRRAVKIITVSESTKKEIVDHYKVKPEKVIVTYEAADGDRDDVQGVKGRCKGYFLYVGNAYPHKNLEKLCEAFLQLKTSTQDLKLILVGGEDYFYKRLAEHIRKMGFYRKVILYGQASRKELTSLYKNAIALVFPSLMEGFGLPAVEAMGNGCLVLCSDLPVFREILGEAAVYFNPYDVDEIASKMAEVLNDPQKHEAFKRLGLEKVKQFSWAKLARETLEVYQSLYRNKFTP